MNTQFTLPGFEPVEHKEVVFLESLLSEMKAAVADSGGPPERLTYEPKDSYTVAKFIEMTVYRLHLRGKQHYISLPFVFQDLIPDSFPQKDVKSDGKYFRILVNKDYPIESYRDFLVQIAGETVDRYPKEWDCCSRYLQCSDAKTCVHPDKVFALECGYRKILNKGRIFYGENRNID